MASDTTQDDTSQWLEINTVMHFCIVYFYAVAEEVKHWKSLTHWTTQTVSARLWFGLCQTQTPTASLSFSRCFRPRSIIIWSDAAEETCMPRTSEWTGVMFATDFYFKCKRYNHITTVGIEQVFRSLDLLLLWGAIPVALQDGIWIVVGGQLR